MPSATSNGMASLADLLANTRDRETYSALMCYLNRLPPGDEFRQLAELLGLLSLLGQRIPDAIGELLKEFRDTAKAEAEYHQKLEERLAALPNEILDGVDPAAVAKAMSESFRQQLIASGLQDTASLLKAAAITLKTLSSEVTTTLKPIASTVCDETNRLLSVIEQSKDNNIPELRYQQRGKDILVIIFGVAMFFVGAYYNHSVENRHTSESIREIGLQVQRIETILRSR